MSITPAAGVAPAEAPVVAAPRVRHQAREAVVLMVFSAATSAAFAACLVVVASLGRQG